MRGLFSSPDNDSQLLPALLLLLVVLVPTAFVVWFTKKAMNSERLAARQKLHEAYTSHLLLVAEQVDRRVNEVVDRLEAATENKSPADAFLTAVRQNLADGVVCYDKNCRAAYPDSPPLVANFPVDNSSWSEAQRLEWEAKDYLAASEAYARLADQAESPADSARARQGQIRCLARNGQSEAAIQLIVDTFAVEPYSSVQDEFHRSIAANAELFGLELAKDEQNPLFGPLVQRLVTRLTDYDTPTMTSVQRRFLWRELDRWRDWPSFCENGDPMRLAQAERLAGTFAEQNAAMPTDAGLRFAGIPGYWRIVIQRRKMVALLSTPRVMSIVDGAIAAESMPESLSMDVLTPQDEPMPHTYWLLKTVYGMPGWRLGLRVHESNLDQDASKERNSAHLWTAVVVIATMLILALMIGGTFRRQWRLARLKNDLVATVTHELKTPLSSMRLLVDTLLDTPQLGEPKVREYLQLVAKENSRLTRLIDNFLTFSRMERKKQSFQFVETSCHEIVNSAVQAAGEKLHSADCQLTVNVDEDVPSVVVDPDAMVTVLLNLLDNAYKYTPGEKRIDVRAYCREDGTCLAVSDNGIGLTRAAARRVFERFFQVDQSLSRQTSGCGLGLSIVKYIIAAHGGTVEVHSQSGKGSTFIVCLPYKALRSSGQPVTAV